MKNIYFSRRSKGSIIAIISIISFVSAQVILPLQTSAQVTTSSLINKSISNYSDLSVLEKIKIDTGQAVNVNQKNNSTITASTSTRDLKAMGQSGQLKKSQPVTLNEKYIAGEIIVKYKNSKIDLNTPLGRTAALNFTNTKSLEKKEDLRKNNISVLKIKDTKTVEQKIAELKSDPNVEYAEPNYKRYPSVISTNDPDRSLLWGLDNTGQSIKGTYGNITGTNNKDINAPEAWAINEGTNADVIVAVIDSGVAYNHPDLLANMWNGVNCKDENGNVLGGCNYGYDFEDNDKTPLPTYSSHGTHIAGTIAAVKNNGKGIMGVAPQAKVMAIKYGFDTASEIKSIDFAIQNGAKVINASFTGADFSQAEYDAINRFKAAGGIFVAAAGNEVVDNEGAHSYPSDYDLDNIISVAATDQNDALATFSNYGTTSVDVGAPGTNIYSAVADSVLMSENFNSVNAPNLPGGWLKSGANNKWGTYNFSGDNVLYGQVPSKPYDNNANTAVTSPSYNLSGASAASLSFGARCDTEYGSALFDYMMIEISADGSNFTGLNLGGVWGTTDGKFNEWYLDSDSNQTGGAYYYFNGKNIPPAFLTGNFKFRFRWVTDSTVNNFDGCWVNDISINKFSDGSDEKYNYKDGTSMATPHVAGLAALIEGYSPSLSVAQVKNTILTTGDDIPALHGKTVAGIRINTETAMGSLIPSAIVVSKNASFGNTTTSPDATNVVVGSYDLVAEGLEDVKITSLKVNFSQTSTYNNISLFDGSTLLKTVGSQTEDGSVTISGLDYIIPKSITKTLLITADVSSSTVGDVESTLSDIQAVGVITGNSVVTPASITGQTITIIPPPHIAMLSSIVIDQAAHKLIYAIGDVLDITGLEVIGIYDDGSTSTQSITESSIAGFDSTNEVTGQVLTIAVGGIITSYIIDVVAPISISKDITSFKFLEGVGVISSTDITLNVPYGVVVSALVPTIIHTGVSVSPASGVAQDFTNPVSYIVTAADTSTQVYTVSVIVADPLLSSIAITTPANKLTYTVGDVLDITGLSVTRTYGDATTSTQAVTVSNVSGFDSSVPVVDQILMVTIGAATTTYAITITAAPVIPPSGGGGGGGGGGGNPPIITPVTPPSGGGGGGGGGAVTPQVLGVTTTLADELITEVDGKDGLKVKELQTELIRLGFLPANFTATTKYDAATQAAVKKYQASKISVVTPDIQYSKKLNNNFVKVNGSPAVYWFSAEGKRYLFSNRDTFGSWFGDDFAGLRTISQDEFNNIQLGENITIKPGEYLKFDNSNITYQVKDNNNICKTSAPVAPTFLIQSGFEVDYNKIGVCAQ